MAFVITIHCLKCNENRQVTVGSGQSSPSICHVCADEEADATRRKHFHELDGLTVEERLRRIEQWMYDYKPPRDIKY